MKDLLVIFAKAPEPGRVKTRLTPAISKECAARLHEAFIMDILDATTSVAAKRALACLPTTKHPFFSLLKKKEPLQFIHQKGEDLGARMRNAFEWGLSEGFQKVVLIGCDAPTLPIEMIQAAFDHLTTTEVVLGPSLDGGYYLIGTKETMPDLFSQLPWGTETVLRETLERVNKKKRRCRLLPFWYDIDRPHDLAFLSAHLRLMARQSAPLPMATMEIINQMEDGLFKK